MCVSSMWVTWTQISSKDYSGQTKKAFESTKIWKKGFNFIEMAFHSIVVTIVFDQSNHWISKHFQFENIKKTLSQSTPVL